MSFGFGFNLNYYVILGKLFVGFKLVVFLFVRGGGIIMIVNIFIGLIF